MNQLKFETSFKNKHFKFLQLISLLYVTFILLTMMIENRVIMIGHFKILSGTLIIPLSYATSDIITEVYGYKEMRRLIWTSILILYLCATIVFVIIHLPTGSYQTEDKPYYQVLSYFLKDAITYSIAAVTSIFLNSYIISKWKLLVKGRIFWLRSLGSTAIGEALFILIWGFLGFSKQFDIQTLLQLMLASYLCKIIYNIFTIIPISIITTLLKNSEKVDVFDYNIKFNPFALKVD